MGGLKREDRRGVGGMIIYRENAEGGQWERGVDYFREG